MDVTLRLAEELAAAAKTRVEAEGLGIVGAVITEDDELEMFELYRDATHQGADGDAWQQVQRWVTESRAGAGGLAYDVYLVEDGKKGRKSAYLVAVEGRDGTTLDFLVPFHRRRRGDPEFKGRIYHEPDRLYLTFD